MTTPTNKELFCGGFLSLLEEQEADVRLKACDGNEETAIHAHKLILAARSKVFKKMFESDKGKVSTKVETITFSELKQEELEAFVDFIYCDGSALSAKEMKHAMSLYRAADKYEIPHLGDLCRETLMISLKPSNALKVLELAEIPFDKVLTDAALTTIINNRSAICNSTEFEAFVVKQPKLTVQIVKAISGCNQISYSYTHNLASPLQVLAYRNP